MLGPAQKRDLKLEKLHENGERVAMVMSTLMYVDVVDKDDDADDDDDVADVTHVADDADDTDVADVADEDEWWWFLVVDIQCLVFLMSETKKKLAPRYKVPHRRGMAASYRSLGWSQRTQVFRWKNVVFWP